MEHWYLGLSPAQVVELFPRLRSLALRSAALGRPECWRALPLLPCLTSVACHAKHPATPPPPCPGPPPRPSVVHRIAGRGGSGSPHQTLETLVSQVRTWAAGQIAVGAAGMPCMH